MKTLVTNLIGSLLLAATLAHAQVPPPPVAPGGTTPAIRPTTTPPTMFAPSTNFNRFSRTPGATPAAPGANVASPATPGGNTPGANANVFGAAGAGGASTGVSNIVPKGLMKTNDMIPANMIKFQELELGQFLEFYAELTGKTLLKSPQVPTTTKISIHNQSALTREEGINALNTILGLNQISVIPQGDKFLKIVPQAGVGPEATPFSTNSYDELPDAQGVPIAQIVTLNHLTPEDALSILGPYTKLPQGLLGVKGSPTLVIRDYAENVKRMLEILAKVDVALPVTIETVVIPIKYATAGEIAGVLSGLGATTGSGISGGAGAAGGFSGGFSGGVGGLGGGGVGGMGGQYGGAGRGGIGSQYGSAGGQYGGAGGINRLGANTTGGAANPGSLNRTGTGIGSRLSGAVNRATGGGGAPGDFVLIGNAKIIPDERSNALLVFAERADLVTISNIISKLDVVLPQVRIEALILEVNLGDGKSLGVSMRQNNQNQGDLDFAGGSVFGPNFINPKTLTGFTGATNLGSGFNYFGKLNQDFDFAVTAAANDSRINVLSRPSIVTSTAKPATIFVGETRPYITGSYYSDFSNAGSRSQYSQLSIGISLNVMPIINQDGLVVMDISQNISQPGDDVTIDGNAVPSTIERNAQSYVAVHDRDTIMLGGFISTTKNKSNGGVPFLKDIPGLGMLFRSSSDSTRRVELMVLIRPTVLPTPEIAALHTAENLDNSPGITKAQREEAEYQRALMDKERKEREKAERRGK
jgi:general secretion pathway protein D